MDYDETMLFVKAHPDCSSLDIADAFGVTVSKAFTFMNAMIGEGLAFKTVTRSPTNNKRVLGYRAIPEFDVVDDNGDGSMKRAHVVRLIQRSLRVKGMRTALAHMYSHNEWRRGRGMTEIAWGEILA